MSTKFNLSIDLFTPHVHDAIDVAQALRGVATASARDVIRDKVKHT